MSKSKPPCPVPSPIPPGMCDVWTCNSEVGYDCLKYFFHSFLFENNSSLLLFYCKRSPRESIQIKYAVTISYLPDFGTLHGLGLGHGDDLGHAGPSIRGGHDLGQLLLLLEVEV